MVLAIPLLVFVLVTSLGLDLLAAFPITLVPIIVLVLEPVT